MADLDDGHGLISADKVEGTAVFNLEGERLGHVETIMLHKMSGQVAYAVMAFGGFLGLGEKHHPLPWSMLRYDTEHEGYVVSLTRAQLEAAPAMTRAEIGEDDRDWGRDVHTFYQVTPSWM